MLTVKKFSTSLVISSLLISYGVQTVYASQRDASKFLKIEEQTLVNEIRKVKVDNKKIIKIDELKKLLQENNQELSILESRIIQSKFDLRNKIAAWYPNLNLSSNGLPQYLDGSTDNEFSNNTSSRQWKSSISATIEWDLINPSRIPEINEARNKLENAKLIYLIEFRNTYLDALSKYFILQQSNEYLRIAKDSIKISKTSLKEANIRLESGIGTKFEVLEAKSQLAKDRQFLIKTIGEKKINQRALAQILNLDEKTSPIITSRPRKIGNWIKSLEESIISAYNFREEFKQARIELSMNDNNAKSILAASKPVFSLYNTYNTSFSEGEANAISPNDENSVYSQNNTVGLKFNWKIYNGGSVRASYNAKKEKNNELLANLELKKSQIRKEVEESFFNLEIAEKNILNTLEEVKSAKESLRLALIRLKAGITTQREVVTNQRDLTQAEVNYIEAITNFNSNLVHLRQQTGIDEMTNCIVKRRSGKSKEYKTFSPEICLKVLS